MSQLILASESPRRRQLLQDSGFIFEVVPVKVSEIPNKNLNVNDQILDIARRKATAALAELKPMKSTPFVVLSADTEVIFDGGPLGKPLDTEDAHRLLRLLSGKTHEVKTAVCLIESSSGQEFSQVETSRVNFHILSEEEILDYVATGEPMDKAGAYAIQGIGRKLVENFEGPYDNIVGLPVEVVRAGLKKLGITGVGG